MGWNGFEIEIYEKNGILHHERFISAVRGLPRPQGVRAHLDSCDTKVFKGQLDKEYELFYPTSKQVVEFFSDMEISKALYSANFYFGTDEEKGQTNNINIYIDAKPEQERKVKQEYTEVEKGLQDWIKIISVNHDRGEKGQLDKRVFDYGEIIVQGLIPIGAKQDYFVIPHGLGHEPSIMNIDEFLKNIGKLKKKNCKNDSTKRITR